MTNERFPCCTKCNRCLFHSKFDECKSCRAVPCKICSAPTTAVHRVCAKHKLEQQKERNAKARNRKEINDAPGVTRRIGTYDRSGEKGWSSK